MYISFVLFSIYIFTLNKIKNYDIIIDSVNLLRFALKFFPQSKSTTFQTSQGNESETPTLTWAFLLLCDVGSW